MFIGIVTNGGQGAAVGLVCGLTAEAALQPQRLVLSFPRLRWAAWLWAARWASASPR